MRGISANVMVGQEGMFGTNAFQIILDIERMKQITISEKDKYHKDSSQDVINQYFSHIEESGSQCSASKLKLNNNITIHETTDTKLTKEALDDDGYSLDGL